MMAQQLAAFQGERGAFSEMAARQLLGDGVPVLPCPRFDLAFAAVAGGEASCAVIPIENTLHGSVYENYDHLLNHQLAIERETQVRIVHDLIAPPGVALSAIKRVFSHPVALNQCLKFFVEHPEIEKVPFYDTAGSVKMLMEELPTDAAAIASGTAAEVYGGRVLKHSIEDDRQNFTRFFLLQPQATHQQPVEATEEWKTSLVFSTPNAPGALFRAMSAFALRDLSLTKIESRPIKGKPWEYWFYLDFLGHTSDPKVQKALGHLEELASFLRVLGSYPRGC